MTDHEEKRYFSFEERQKQKARSRQRDEERLARGEISAADLQRENMPFRNLRADRIGIPKQDGSGELGCVSKVVEIACARPPSVSRFAFSSGEVKGHRLEGL